MDISVLNQKVKSRNVARILRQAFPGWNLYREKLHYYRKSGLLQPEQTGPGRDALYPISDVILLTVIGELIENGLTLQNIRKVVDYVRANAPELVDDNIGELFLSVTGDGDAAWFDPSDPRGAYGISVLKRPGQRYLLPTKRRTKKILEVAEQEGLLQQVA